MRECLSLLTSESRSSNLEVEAAVAEAQRLLAAQLQVDPSSLASQVEYNLAATRARLAATRAAEAGRQARVAQATAPPIATDAPT